jgi:hypothetical protein
LIPVRPGYAWGRIRSHARPWTLATSPASATPRAAPVAPPTSRTGQYAMTVTCVPRRMPAGPAYALEQTQSPVWHPTDVMMWVRAIPRPGNVRNRPSRMERFAATAMRVLSRTPVRQESASQGMPSGVRRLTSATTSGLATRSRAFAATRPRPTAVRAATATSARKGMRARVARAWSAWLPMGLSVDPLAAVTRAWAGPVANIQTLTGGAKLRCISCSCPSKSALLLARNFQKERRALALARRELYPSWARATEIDEDLLGPGRWDQ